MVVTFFNAISFESLKPILPTRDSQSRTIWSDSGFKMKFGIKQGNRSIKGVLNPIPMCGGQEEGVFLTPSSNSPKPAGCPTVQLKSATLSPEIAVDCVC